jgi:hypothetical protein
MSLAPLGLVQLSHFACKELRAFKSKLVALEKINLTLYLQVLALDLI